MGLRAGDAGDRLCRCGHGPDSSRGMGAGGHRARNARVHSGAVLLGLGRRRLAAGGIRHRRRRADHAGVPCFLSAQAAPGDLQWRSKPIRSMREIKFACPHCSQHVACDEAYCGYQIRCPACQAALIVPRLAAFGIGAAPANLSLALPVATPVPRQVAATLSSRAWSEKEWDRHAVEAGESKAPQAWGGTILLLLFFAPALLALLFADAMSRQGGGASRGQWLWTAWMIFTPICSLLCAAGLSQMISKRVPVRVVIMIVLAPFIWGLNASISLFLGCIAGLMSAAARGG